MRLHIDELVSYSKCGLAYKYSKIANAKVDYKEAVYKSFNRALSAYLTEASKDGSSVAKATNRAITAYNNCLIEYDKLKIFDVINFSEFYYKGTALLNKVIEEIDPKWHRPVSGRIKDLSYSIQDHSVYADLPGLISFYDASNPDRYYSVPVIRGISKVYTTQDLIIDSFYYSIVRRSLGEVKQYPLSLLVIDPIKLEIKNVDLQIEYINSFNSIALSLINGIKNGIVYPNLGTGCYICPFYKVCRVSDSNNSDYVRRGFLERYESIN